MFSLLRRIRRRLAADGSFRKYLLYASSEFVLIVGDVLVALSLNNWKIEKKNREEEEAILGQILGELRSMNRPVNRIRNGIEPKPASLLSQAPTKGRSIGRPSDRIPAPGPRLYSHTTRS